MKTCLALAFSLLLTASLCACGRAPAADTLEKTTLPTEIFTTSAGETTLPAQAPSEMDAYKAVLEGSKSFLTEDGAYLDISQIGSAITPDETAAPLFRLKNFAVLDLDGDGTSELILKAANGNDDAVACIVIRYQDGEVYSTTMYHRTFYGLKEDGTFWFSGSASNNGFGRLRLTPSGWETEILAQQYEEAETQHYEVAGLPTDVDAFAAAGAVHAEVPDAVWFDSWDTYVRYQGSPSPAAYTNEREAFAAVLQGEEVFFSTDSSEYLDISGILDSLSYYEPDVTIERFALVDLDQDGASELLLWLAQGTDPCFGYVVLRYHDGRVFGYNCGYRSFADLKADGTFMISYDGTDGAFRSGYGTMSFTGRGRSVEAFADCQELYDEDFHITETIYTRNQESVTREVYLEAEKQQQAKPDAVWYDSWETMTASLP